MERISKADALSRVRFHAELREWFDRSDYGETVGNATSYGGRAWVWIRHLGNRYYLNADTTHSGVAEYLNLVVEYGEDIQWRVVANEKGRENKVAFGPDQATVTGFYLYRA